MVNPATTKRNKENRDNSPSKNDPKMRLIIADSVSRGFYYEYTRQSLEFQRLKTMMSDREFWVTNSVRLQNRIVRWLDIRFPEYPSVFKDWTCKRSLATLKTFPCPEILRSIQYRMSLMHGESICSALGVLRGSRRRRNSSHKRNGVSENELLRKKRKQI